MKTKYINGQKIKYESPAFCGVGVVRGIAITEKPFVGIGYIVEDLSNNVPNETYPFDCMVVFENWISEVE